MCTLYIYFVYIRGGSLHVILLNRHGMGIWVQCMTPYDKYRQFTPNPEGALAVMQCCLITASRRTANASESRELHAWKQSPLDIDHVLILNASLTWTDKALRTQLFAKWSVVLVCPTSLIRHKSKYSIIFPYLRYNVSECETIIYYANDRLVLQSRSKRSNGWCLVHRILFW